MRRFVLTLLPVLMIACTLVFPIYAEEGGEKPPKCSQCGGTGKISDSKCPDKSPYKCSYTNDEFPSRGFGFLVCPNCKGAQSEWDILAADYDKWIEARRERIDKWVFGKDAAKYKVGHSESEHFVVCGTLKDGNDWDGRKSAKMSARQRAHNYLRICEEIYKEHFLKLLGLDDYHPQEKWELTIWGGGGEIEKASNRLVGNTQTCISTFQGKLLTIPDSSGRGHTQAIIFNLFCLVIQEYEGCEWKALPDWFWEGYAHYVENAAFGSVENNMADEAAGAGGGLGGSNFDKRLKVMFKSGRYPNIVDFGDLNVSKLGFRERLMAWGLIDWIHKAYGPKKLELFVRILKRTKSQAMAFKDAIGVPFHEVSAEYCKWALENY